MTEAKPPVPYQRLPIAEKRALDLSRARQPAVTCPDCDLQVMPVDLLNHLRDRCGGLRPPGPADKWVSFREALALGVPRGTLSRWVDAGLVRVMGAVQDRRYLHRDLALRVARRKGFHRR